MCYSTAAKRKMDVVKKIGRIISGFNDIYSN